MSIVSPCVRVCRLNAAKTLCTGCGRTLTQIGAWAGYTDAERERIMRELAATKTRPASDPQGEGEEKQHES